MSVTLKVLTFRLLIFPHTGCRGDGGSGGEEITRLVGTSVTAAGECIDTHTGRPVRPEYDKVCQGEEALARHVMHRHGVA